MKLFVVLLITVFQTINVISQVTVSGKVLSSEDNQPLTSSTITVFKAGTKELVTGAITNEQGRFTVSNLPAGEYDFMITYIGFEPINRRLLAGTLNNVYDLGNIFLKPATRQIGEVEISGDKQSLSSGLDRKSYNIENFVSGSAGSALDILKTLPGIVIDQDSRIILRGSDKVAILIDGKQSSLTGFGSQKGLENIPASQIESIEIINNPSARYDAAGMAGIVNIKFKKSEIRGISGDLGITPGIGMITKRKADLPTGMPSYSGNWKITPSLNLTYKREKLNFFLQSYITYQRRLPNNEFTTRYYDNGRKTESQVSENRSQKHYNFKLGLDWNPTPRQTITIFGLYDYEWHIDTTRVWYFEDEQYNLPLRKWGFHESEGTGFTNFTLQHKYRFEQSGHELNSQFLFTKGWEDETYNLSQAGPAPYPLINTDKTRVLAPEYVYLLSSDYIRPLSFGRFEAGISGKMRHMPITYTVTRDPANTALLYNFGDWSKWDESIAGGYINMVADFEATSIEAGIRGEYTNVTYEFAPNAYFSEDRYDYFSLFPNIRFTLKATGSDKISLFYNRRIDRPGEDILRIFPKYDDPELLKIGNPSLKPQFTQNFELSYKHSWTAASFYTSLYHKIIDDYYTRIYIQDPLHAEITVKAYDNLGKATNTGAETGIDLRIMKFWKLSASLNLYRNTIYAHSGQIDFPVVQDYTVSRRSDFPLFSKLISQFSLPSDYILEITGQYFSAKNIGQGRELARGGVDLGMKKLLAGKKLEINLSATDILNTMGIRQKIDGQGFRVDYQNYYETQVILLSCRYRF